MNRENLQLQRQRSNSYTWPFRTDFDRLFDTFCSVPWSGVHEVKAKDGLSWSPSLDVAEDDEAVTITLEIPGIDPKAVDVSVRGNTLTIEGEKREEKEDKKKDYYVSERSYGSFKRTLEFPKNIDLENIKADYSNGLLKLTAKKIPTEEKKKIQICCAN